MSGHVKGTRALDVACPKCGIPAGGRCVDNSGRFHSERALEASRITREANRAARIKERL